MTHNPDDDFNFDIPDDDEPPRGEASHAS